MTPSRFLCLDLELVDLDVVALAVERLDIGLVDRFPPEVIA